MKQAATRDASWVNCPNTTDPKKYHIVGDDCRAACNRLIVLLNDDDDYVVDDLNEVPPFQRCQRRGCKEHWPQA